MILRKPQEALSRRPHMSAAELCRARSRDRAHVRRSNLECVVDCKGNSPLSSGFRAHLASPAGAARGEAPILDLRGLEPSSDTVVSESAYKYEWSTE